MTFYASIMLIVGRFEINDEQRRLKRIVIAAIECDKERYEKETTEVRALSVFPLIIISRQNFLATP
jgi:hypothetical protein